MPGRARPFPSPRSLAALLALGLSAIAAGATAPSVAATPVGFPTPADEADSFRPFAQHRIEGVPAARWLADRQALLLSGAARTARGVAGGGTFSGAAILTADGYLLTVAHGLREPVFALRDGAHGRPELTSARVVWRGSEGGCDAALLHVPWVAPAPCAWAEPAAVAAGTPLLAAGASRIEDDARQWVRRDRSAGIAGAAPEVGRPRAGEPAFAWIRATLPAQPGDSGGPVLTLDGRLVGVMAAHLQSRAGDSTGWSLVIRPDPAFLRAAIDADRRSAASPAATP